MIYDIKPIPTMYDGVRYRSKLEARWAVFFTAVGIEFEYEPDTYGTKHGVLTPDFLLYFDYFTALIEVKPGSYDLHSCECTDLCDKYHDLTCQINKNGEGPSVSFLLVAGDPYSVQNPCYNASTRGWSYNNSGCGEIDGMRFERVGESGPACIGCGSHAFCFEEEAQLASIYDFKGFLPNVLTSERIFK